MRKMLKSDKTNFKVVESYATNILFVLGLQQVGGGPADCQVILTYLGLPHSQSFSRKSFGKVEAKLRPLIKKISDDTMDMALDEETKLSWSTEDYEKWTRNELPAQANGLTVCYDMGWNKRSSGNRYDSISGHGIAFGAQSKKILAYRSVSKVCSFCSIYKKKHGENSTVERHDCVKNHWGSSKSMECEAILHITRDSFINRNFHIAVVVSDDDTTMKKILRHDYELMIAEGLM